jgi:hypothetical protein
VTHLSSWSPERLVAIHHAVQHRHRTEYSGQAELSLRDSLLQGSVPLKPDCCAMCKQKA